MARSLATSLGWGTCGQNGPLRAWGKGQWPRLSYQAWPALAGGNTVQPAALGGAASGLAGQISRPLMDWGKRLRRPFLPQAGMRLSPGPTVSPSPATDERSGW